MAVLERITVYPLKSFQPVSINEAVVLPSGALLNDRRFALIDSEGRFINAKRTPLVHQLVLNLDPVERTLSGGLRAERTSASNEGAFPREFFWHIDDSRNEIEEWLSNYFSTSVSLAEKPDGGFPDDTEASGPTIISQATWSVVAEWFPELSVNELRLRFRANLEVANVSAFWEDFLFRADSIPQPFVVGSAQFVGVNPCQRCVVPSRDSPAGEITPDFAKIFSSAREQTLSNSAARSRFNHFYRLTTNTRGVASTSVTIRIGDEVRLK